MFCRSKMETVDLKISIIKNVLLKSNGQLSNCQRKKILKHCALIYIDILKIKLAESKKRRFAVRDLFKNRIAQGDGFQLLQEMMLTDHEMFFEYTRMDVSLFENILSKIGPRLQKREMVTAIPPAQRLSMTLRFLAAGDCLGSLSFSYRCGKSTVSSILKDTLPLLAETLADYVRPPSSSHEWTSVADEFYSRWNLPNCVGAIDGKHVVIQCPQASESLFFNYKKEFSIVLLAAVDANYCILVTDIGAEGSQSDSAIFQESVFGRKLLNNDLCLPEPKNLPNTLVPYPYYFVGDAAFPLKTNLMKPYSKQNMDLKEATYNYRISRARRVVENAFGILAARWRILRKPFASSLPTARSVVRAVVALHNYIRKTNPDGEYCPQTFIDTEAPSGEVINGEWRRIISTGSAFSKCSTFGSNNYTKRVDFQRNILKEYSSGKGQVPWQDKIVKKGFWGADITT